MTTTYRLRVISTADGWLVFNPPVYVRDWEAAIGMVILTGDPAFAYPFRSLEAAMETWRFTDLAHPIRPDGLPNRPLTAFTVQPEPVP